MSNTGVYERLGVRTVINASGTLTRLGGSRMAPAVLEAMAEASRSYVRIEDLQEGVKRCLLPTTAHVDPIEPVLIHDHTYGHT